MVYPKSFDSWIGDSDYFGISICLDIFSADKLNTIYFYILGLKGCSGQNRLNCRRPIKYV